MPDSGLMTTAEVLERYRSGPASGVFTDGSCSGNPGPGGWGVVRVRDGRVVAEQHGYDPATTNNRMEFEAMIAGLEMIDTSEAETIYSDSRLVVQTINEWAAGWARRGWKRRTGPVKNLDLVQRAYALAPRAAARAHRVDRGAQRRALERVRRRPRDGVHARRGLIAAIMVAGHRRRSAP